MTGTVEIPDAQTTVVEVLTVAAGAAIGAAAREGAKKAASWAARVGGAEEAERSR